MTVSSHTLEPSSFRDPSGHVIRKDGLIYRVIHPAYQPTYQHLMRSGLYDRLVSQEQLIPHTRCDDASVIDGMANERDMVIQPTMVPFISYPYEWCFGQLKDAALTTLAIQKQALEFDMSLKDANAYNIQFYQGKPLLIDTLSFERYDETQPWIAYQQFCEQFLAPLAIMAYRDVRLNVIRRYYHNGIPLDLASRLLPWSTYLHFPLLVHIHWHQRSLRHGTDRVPKKPVTSFSRFKMLALIDSLESALNPMTIPTKTTTEWARYYDDTPYSTTAFRHKQTVVSQWIDTLKPARMWDIGANTGVFSRLGTHQPNVTVAMDNDPMAIETLYQSLKNTPSTPILPLYQDITNPSAALGWNSRERESLYQRGPSDLILALALLHHLVITQGIPIDQVVDGLAAMGRSVILEFVPKSDKQVQVMLTHRPDVFDDYTASGIEAAFSRRFIQHAYIPIEDSDRQLYLFTRKD